jgi:hypothetical protein
MALNPWHRGPVSTLAGVKNRNNHWSEFHLEELFELWRLGSERSASKAFSERFQ